MAEDAVAEDIDQFIIEASQGLNSNESTPQNQSRVKKEVPATKPAASSARVVPPTTAPANGAPATPGSNVDSKSANSSPASPIPKRAPNAPLGTSATPLGGRRRRQASGVQDDNSRSGLSQSIVTVVRQAIKLSPPKLQKLAEKELKTREKNAKRSLAKSEKILSKFAEDDTKPAVDAIRQTILELGATNDPQVVPVISKYLDDVRPSLPEAALRGLASTRCPEAFEPLALQLLKTSPEAAGGVLSALGDLGDRRAVRLLVSYGAEYPQYQMRVVDAISDIGPESVPSLIELSGSNEAGEQLITCLAMGKVKDERCLESLSGLLRHEIPTLRCHAAEALGELGEQKGVKFLIGALKDSDPNVRASTAIALSKLPDERNVAPLIRCLSDPDRHVRLYSINALAAVGDKAAAPALTELLEQDDPEILAAACDALGRMGDPKAVERLIQFLVPPANDEHAGFVLKVIETVRRLQSPQAVPALMELLQSTDPTVRLKAVEAIGQCKDKSAAEVVEQVLAKDNSDEVRAAAAKALGDLKDPESLQALTESLQDTFNVRVKAIIALGAIKNSNAVPMLMPLLKDQSPEIRYHSSQALAELGHKKAIHQIELLAVDEVPMVARGALKAIQKLGDDRPEKKIIASAKKRAKATKSVISGARSPGFDISELLAGGVMEIVWPEDPQRRMINVGVFSTLLLVPLLVLGYLMMQPRDFIVLRRSISSASFSPDSQHLYVSNLGGSIEYWSQPTSATYSSRVFVDSQGITDLFAMDGGESLAVSVDTLYRVKDSDSSEVLKLPISAEKMKISADRKHALIVDVSRNGYPIDLSTMAPGTPMVVGPNLFCEFGHDGSYVICLTENEQLQVKDLGGKVTTSFKLPGRAASMALSDDGAQLAVGFFDGAIEIWSPKDKKKILRLEAKEKSPVYSLNFAHDGSKLYAKGILLREITLADQAERNVSCEGLGMRMSPDGKLLVLMVDEESEYVFTLVNLETMEVANTPVYKLY